MNAEREALRQKRSYLLSCIERDRQIPGLERSVMKLKLQVKEIERQLDGPNVHYGEKTA